MRPSHLLRCLALAAAALLLAVAIHPWLPSAARRPGPRTVAEVIATADALGLYHTSDDACRPVHVHHLVVSEWPLTWERADRLRVNDPGHPCWAQTVSVYTPWETMQANYDPTCSAVWGEFFVYGDPALVRKLTGAAP